MAAITIGPSSGTFSFPFTVTLEPERMKAALPNLETSREMNRFFHFFLGFYIL
ncbi:MAG TPA: hypothetical protein PLT43_03915 [Mesotoga sp.]|nr:hypothetical protein [Mesotoga sp.]